MHCGLEKTLQVGIQSENRPSSFSRLQLALWKRGETSVHHVINTDGGKKTISNARPLPRLIIFSDEAQLEINKGRSRSFLISNIHHNKPPPPPLAGVDVTVNVIGYPCLRND